MAACAASRCAINAADAARASPRSHSAASLRCSAIAALRNALPVGFSSYTRFKRTPQLLDQPQQRRVVAARVQRFVKRDVRTFELRRRVGFLVLLSARSSPGAASPASRARWRPQAQPARADDALRRSRRSPSARSCRTSRRRFGRLSIHPSAISSGNAWRIGCRLTPSWSASSCWPIALPARSAPLSIAPLIRSTIDWVSMAASMDYWIQIFKLARPLPPGSFLHRLQELLQRRRHEVAAAAIDEEASRHASSSQRTVRISPAACSAANSGSGSQPRNRVCATTALIVLGERVSTATRGGFARALHQCVESLARLRVVRRHDPRQLQQLCQRDLAPLMQRMRRRRDHDRAIAEAMRAYLHDLFGFRESGPTARRRRRCRPAPPRACPRPPR